MLKTIAFLIGYICVVWTAFDIVRTHAMPAIEAQEAEAYATLFFKNTSADLLHAVPNRAFVITANDKIVHELGLGEEIENQLLVAEVKSFATNDIALQFQWETSLSVHDEGAHLDLLDWKHFTSDWIQVPSVANGKFQVPLLTDEQKQAFPETDLEEVCTVTKRFGGTRWLEVCQTATAVGTYPIRIGVSAYRFRIGTTNTSDWEMVPIIEMKRPLGS